MDGSFSDKSSSSKAVYSWVYSRFSFFALSKNELITNIRYFRKPCTRAIMLVKNPIVVPHHNLLARVPGAQY